MSRDNVPQLTKLKKIENKGGKNQQGQFALAYQIKKLKIRVAKNEQGQCAPAYQIKKNQDKGGKK